MQEPLTERQLESAISYNQERPYSRALWIQIQAAFGVTQDGIPGPNTANAAAAYQVTHALGVDGMVGPATLASMRLGRVFTLPGQAPFFFLGQLAIDADGAPNAYNERDTGIDYLANAGHPGNWWGIATDAAGSPYTQSAEDPAPGYYVSTTALVDGNYSAANPRCYVDSTAIPYVVLPSNIDELGQTGGVRLGDLAAVLLTSNPLQLAYAIYADVGPRCTLDPTSNQGLGEGSVLLSQALGHDPYNGASPPRASRGIGGGVCFLVFPGSGTRKVMSAAEIAEKGQNAYLAWGGQAALAVALGLLGVTVK